jgi:hypothetical protein
LPAEAAVAATLARLHRAVDAQLSALEKLRASLGHSKREQREGDRIAHSLSLLTNAMNTLQRIRCGIADNSHDDNDIPRDIDEFRFALARRIDAFVESRLNAGDAEGREDRAEGMDRA